MMKTEKESPHCGGCMNPLDVYFTDSESACVCAETERVGAYHVSFGYMGESIVVNVNIGNPLSSEEMCKSKAIMMATVKIMKSEYADRLGTGWCFVATASKANLSRINKICWRNTELSGGLVYFEGM